MDSQRRDALVCFMTAQEQISHRASFDDLPRAVHLSIVLKAGPGLVARVRLALVSKTWAALLNEPLFWAEIDFEGAGPGLAELDERQVLWICRKSKGCLRSLDLTAAEHISSEAPSRKEHGLLTVLVAEGLMGRVESLLLSPDKSLFCCSENSVRQLRAAFPALQRTRVDVTGAWPGAVAAMQALSGVSSDGVLSIRRGPHQQQQRPAPASALRVLHPSPARWQRLYLASASMSCALATALSPTHQQE